jgi:5,10-methylenetetrahydrofolate reductase
MIGILNKKKLEKLANILKNIKITNEEIEKLEEMDDNDDENEDKACAYMHIKGFKENIEYCIKNDLEMIIFCH